MCNFWHSPCTQILTHLQDDCSTQIYPMYIHKQVPIVCTMISEDFNAMIPVKRRSVTVRSELLLLEFGECRWVKSQANYTFMGLGASKNIEVFGNYTAVYRRCNSIDG